jgi:hypothetical protein
MVQGTARTDSSAEVASYSSTRIWQSYMYVSVLGSTPPYHPCGHRKTRAQGLRTAKSLCRQHSSVILANFLTLVISQNSGLHLALHRLARFPADLFPGDATHKFRARARRILERWEPFHRADLCKANTLTLWAVKGIRTLVFIPLNDRKRSFAVLIRSTVLIIRFLSSSSNGT